MESQQKSGRYCPYQCPAASHSSADCLWGQSLLFLCSFLLLFKLEPLIKGFCWSRKPSRLGKVYYSTFLWPTDLSLYMSLFQSRHVFRLSFFQSAAPLFLRALVLLSSKEAIRDGVLLPLKISLGQFRLQVFTNWPFLIWISPCILEVFGTSPSHPFSSLRETL